MLATIQDAWNITHFDDWDVPEVESVAFELVLGDAGAFALEAVRHRHGAADRVRSYLFAGEQTPEAACKNKRETFLRPKSGVAAVLDPKPRIDRNAMAKKTVTSQRAEREKCIMCMHCATRKGSAYINRKCSFSSHPFVAFFPFCYRNMYALNNSLEIMRQTFWLANKLLRWDANKRARGFPFAQHLSAALFSARYEFLKRKYN